MERDEDAKKKLLHKDDEEELSLMKRMWEESKLMWVVAGPAIFTRFSTFGIQIISQAFVGHIGSKELAAYSLVFTVLVRFVNGILVCLHSLSTILPIYSCYNYYHLLPSKVFYRITISKMYLNYI